MINKKTSRILNVVNVAMCPYCKADLKYKIEYAECSICKKHYNIKDNVLFLNNPPQDVPKRSTRKLLGENWSKWRIENSVFLKKYIDTLSKDTVILDLGSGKSPYREYLNSEIFPNLISVDFGIFELIDITADLNVNIPFKDESVDVIVLSNVLEHVFDPKHTLSECYRVLKKDGFIIGHTPFLMGLHDEPYDYYRYTTYALNYLLKEVGFVRVIVQELSSTDDILNSLVHQYFSLAFKQNRHQLLLRILRKNIFLTLFLMKRFFGETQDCTQPKGYGWVGYRQN